MKPQHLVAVRGNSQMRDVGKPHAANLHNSLCHSHMRQAIVLQGRTQAADTLHLGRVPGQSVKPTQHKTRSRGCPRAQKPFLPFALLPSWQLAAANPSLKPSISKIRPFRPSRPTPANTSKTSGRAQGAFCAMPALFPCSATTGGAA